MVTDQLGREFSTTKKIDRVITLMPNLTEIVFNVGAGEMLVASSLADSYPEEVTALPRFNSLPLDHEQILVNSPDLLLAVDGLNNLEDAKKLEELGIPTYYLKFESLQDIAESMTEIGHLLGTQEEAKKARDRFEDGIRPVNPSGQSVLVLNGLEVLYSFGATSYVNELVERSGGRLISDSLESNAVVLSDEFVIAENPDLILLASKSEMSIADLLVDRPSWRGIKAIKSKRLFTLDPDILLRPSPRITQAVDSLKIWLQSTGTSS